MTIEDRLRNAIAARTRSVEPSDDGLERINEKLLETGDDMKITPQNRWYVVAAAAAVVLALAGSALALTAGDGDNGRTTTANEPDPPDDTTTTDGTTTSTSPTTTVADDPVVGPEAPTAPEGPPPTDVVERAVWPRPSSDVRFDDPVAAASSWARFYSGFTAPEIGEFQQGDSRSGEVVVQPRAGSAETVVLVRQLGDDNWYVIGSVTTNITVTTPATGAQLSCPQVFQGTALAFEGTVQVEIDAYQPDGDRVTVGSGIVTGGGGPAAPFDGRIPCTLPTGVEPYGIVRLYTVDESGEEGRSGTWEVASFPVKLG